MMEYVTAASGVRQAQLPEPQTLAHLSYSQLSAFLDCPRRYLLSRLYGLDTGTWYATLAGSAVHEATADIDTGTKTRDEAWFMDYFNKFVDRDTALGIDIKASGRKLKEYSPDGGPGKKDYQWFQRYGDGMITQWLDDMAALDGWSIATLDGKPAVELECGMTVDGVPVVGSIDRVLYHKETGRYAICDLKTGKEPAHGLQLKTYQVMLEASFGVRASHGCYWVPFKGFTGWRSLDTVSDSQLLSLYEYAVDAIRHDRFIPQPSGQCFTCPVKEYCWAVEGDQAHRITK